MRAFFACSVLASVLVFGGCSDLWLHNQTEATHIEVFKNERRMVLFDDDTILSTHDIDLGFAPVGHKQQEGDGRTPEGRYYVNRRNPDSRFHLSLGLSYPNAQDIAAARAAGIDPGKDIFIHGRGNPRRWRGDDWTDGCIAVSNWEMERIYARVSNGTPVDIYP